FIARRLVQAVPVVLAIVVLNFFLLHLAPGDAATVLAGEAGSATPEYMAQLRARFGLDQPLALQLWAYARNILTLNLGHSFRHDQPVFTLIVARLWPTLLLMMTTLVLSVTVGSLLGLLAATGLHRWRDTVISIFALVSYATPLFWLGPHAAERAPARGDHGGAADGGPAGRLRHRRDGLRLAGARAPGLSVALRARSEPAPRHLPPLGLHGGGGESGRGYSLHAARPTHRGGLMAAFSRRYGRNRAAVLGLCFLGAVVLLALAAPWISPG